jgi:hypothetical protein
MTTIGGRLAHGGTVGLVRVLPLLLAALLLPAVASAATVTRFPASNTGAGWTNPTNAYADDTAYASATLATKRATATGTFSGFHFDTAIPAGSTINSVTVNSAWYVNVQNPIVTFAVTPTAGNAISTSVESTVMTPVSSAAATGVTLAQLLDAVFSVAVTYTHGNDTNSQTAYFDYVSVTVDYTPPVNGTTLGAVSATQATGATPSLAITANFTGDDDANNSATFATSSNGGATWSAETALTRNGSPTNTFTGTASGLTCGATYLVRVTATDSTGLTGSPATSAGVLMSNCTLAGAVSATSSTCQTANVSAQFTRDANNDGSTSFARSTTGSAPWTAATCAADTGVSPRTCADAPAAGSYYYQATFTDPDGVTGRPDWRPVGPG